MEILVVSVTGYIAHAMKLATPSTGKGSHPNSLCHAKCQFDVKSWTLHHPLLMPTCSMKKLFKIMKAQHINMKSFKTKDNFFLFHMKHFS